MELFPSGGAGAPGERDVAGGRAIRARHGRARADRRTRPQHDRTVGPGGSNEANPSGDIDIVEIGLRPGEKLYEELLIGNNPTPTGHPRILKADEAYMPIDELSEKLERLSGALASGSRTELMSILLELVPEFQSGGELVDWVHLRGASSIEPPRANQRAARSA